MEGSQCLKVKYENGKFVIKAPNELEGLIADYDIVDQKRRWFLRSPTLNKSQKEIAKKFGVDKK